MPERSITGEISIEPCKSVRKPHDAACILILGPTGAGKSSFIEALAGQGQSLGISKDQLAGFTQEVTAYEVKNAWNDDLNPLYLIDTPGFSDSKISELEIITKVKQWITDQGVGQFNDVLYLTPITDTRAPGSKRRTIKMIQSLLEVDGFQRLYIITTMWDRVSNPQAEKRAGANLAQLQHDIWQGAIIRGTNICRYYNNFDSAIGILRFVIYQFHTFTPLVGYPIQPGEPAAPFLYQELLDRITSAQQEKELLRQEKMQLISKPDPLLESVVLSRLPGVKDDLSRFLGQLVAFGTPPPGFEGVPERCVYQDILDHVNEAREERAALKVALADLPKTPNSTREATLTGQLDLVERELENHTRQLVEHAGPPNSFKIQHDDPSASIIYQALLDRITNSRLTKKSLQQEKLDIIAKPNPPLNSALLSRLLEVKNEMAKLIGQLAAFDSPPPGFEVRPDYQYLLDQVDEAREEQAALEAALTQLHTKNDREQKAALKSQLDLAEHEIRQHVKRLGAYGAPPEGYERDLKRVLDGVSLGGILQYHMEKGLRSFKDKVGFHSRHDSESRR